MKDICINMHKYIQICRKNAQKKCNLGISINKHKYSQICKNMQKICKYTQGPRKVPFCEYIQEICKNKERNMQNMQATFLYTGCAEICIPHFVDGNSSQSSRTVTGSVQLVLTVSQLVSL